MNPHLLEYYNAELAYLRELGQEFAEDFPKIANRLGMNGVEVADPYVERLLQASSFLTAHVQLKMDAQFPHFSRGLLGVHYPNYLAPTPSMAVVELQPDMKQGSLAAGFTIPRDSAMLSGVPRGEDIPCEFRTAHDVTLWPLEIAEVSCTGAPPDLPLSGLRFEKPVKGAVRIRLKTTKGEWEKLPLDQLTFYFAGDDVASQLQEIIFAHALGVIGCETHRPVRWFEFLPFAAIRSEGFDNDQALIPLPAQSGQEYRTLHEYFACPHRYRFMTLTGLNSVVRRVKGNALDLTILLDCSVDALEGSVSKEHLALFCTPVINLFPKRNDALEIDKHAHQHHIVADKNYPLNFEIYAINSVTVEEEESTQRRELHPIHHALHEDEGIDVLYYSSHRQPRMLADAKRNKVARTSYHASEVFLTLTDGEQKPASHALKSLSVDILCTNRDLAFQIPTGEASDFEMVASVPVAAVKLRRGPTEPKTALAENDKTWRLISHLNLNFLTLTDASPNEGAQALRELLSLYAPLADTAVKKHIDAIRHCSLKPVTRRLPSKGQIAFGRGISIDLTIDETLFAGGSPYLLGAVLEKFFARHVGQHSFTETTLHSVQRGEICRWPIRMGKRPSA